MAKAPAKKAKKAKAKKTANRSDQSKPWQFQKGTSGNPSGRPKRDAEVKAMAREHTEEAIQRLSELMRSDDERVSRSACADLLDRGWGRPSQAFTGPDEGPIRVNLTRLSDAKVRQLADIVDEATDHT